MPSSTKPTSRILEASGEPIKRSRESLLPDSEMLFKILPKRTDMETHHLHFVNREDSMLSLLSIHWQHFLHRTEFRRDVNGQLVPHFDDIRAPDNSPVSFPLVEGTGKSTFGRKYLAMVERFRVQIMVHTSTRPENAARFDISRLVLEAENQGTSDELTAFRHFLRDIRLAKSVIVKLMPQSMNCCDQNVVLQSCLDQIVAEICATFRCELDGINALEDFFERIPKPVFIVLDDIGKAFESTGSDQEQELCFREFCRLFCRTAVLTSGVFILLAGDAPFMSAMCEWKGIPDLSADSVSRIKLSPMGANDVRQILEHTDRNGQPIMGLLSEDDEFLDSDDDDPVDLYARLYHILRDR
jgi:hypothetical protein